MADAPSAGLAPAVSAGLMDPALAKFLASQGVPSRVATLVDVTLGADPVDLNFDQDALLTVFNLHSGGTHGLEIGVLKAPPSPASEFFGRVAIITTVEMVHNDDCPCITLEDATGNVQMARYFFSRPYYSVEGQGSPSDALQYAAVMDYLNASIALSITTNGPDGSWQVADDAFNTDSGYDYTAGGLEVNYISIMSFLGSPAELRSSGLPQSDPHVAGLVYVDTSTHTLKVSTG
jgi:hypothetical protein